jgi:hypothetical protein
MVGAVFLVAAGCEMGGGHNSVAHDEAVSDCGGFNDWAATNFKDGPDEYCAAERLHWEYNAQSGVLSLADNRILLNCCGNHSIDVSLENGVYVVTEIDAPEYGDARCACMCVYDYTVDIKEVPAGVISLKIVREVTDWPDGSGVVFEGDLDLSQGSGVEIIDDEPETTWCNPPMM